jgi:hypothetical protein
VDGDLVKKREKALLNLAQKLPNFLMRTFVNTQLVPK